MTDTAVAKVANDLRQITELACALPEQAAQEKHRDLSDSRALADLAPVANQEAWEHKHDAAEAAAIDGRRAWPDLRHEDDSDMPALQLLVVWSEPVRRQYDAELDGRVATLESEASFLRYYADAIWRSEPRWDEFARDVRRAKTRLEDVLKAGIREQFSRVCCDKIECDARPLIVLMGATPEQDHWKCPSCHRKFNDEEYQRAAASQLRRTKARRYVRQTEAVAVLRERKMPAKTIHNWLSAPLKHVKNRCPKCRRSWPVEEVDPTPCGCGQPLMKVFKGNAENVVDGYCDLQTRQTFLWWPDLWTKHLKWRNRAALLKTVA